MELLQLLLQLRMYMDTRIDDIELVATGENAGAFEVTYGL